MDTFGYLFFHLEKVKYYFTFLMNNMAGNEKENQADFV